LGPSTEDSIELDFNEVYTPTTQDCISMFLSINAIEDCIDSCIICSGQTHPGLEKVKVRLSVASGEYIFYIAVNHVFVWTRKARQFLNSCSTFMAISNFQGGSDG